MTTLPESLLLLALDDARGTVPASVRIGLDFGLAGAVIAELAARNCLQMDGKKVSAAATATSIDGDALLADALATIAGKPGKKVEWWVRRMSHLVGGLRQRVLDRLIAQGTLEQREQRVLLLFHQKVYPERDERVERDIRRDLDGVLLQGNAPDARTRWLIQLAAACKVLDAIYPSADRRKVRARVKVLAHEGDDVTSSAVASAIAAEQAAVMAAVIGASVAATAASTAAACSAGATSC